MAKVELMGCKKIVHDIDPKDAEFGHDETSGIAHLILGWRLQPADAARIDRGGALLDDLYE